VPHPVETDLNLLTKLYGGEGYGHTIIPYCHYGNYEPLREKSLQGLFYFNAKCTVTKGGEKMVLNRQRKWVSFLLCGLLFCLASAAQAVVPAEINYQGLCRVSTAQSPTR